MYSTSCRPACRLVGDGSGTDWVPLSASVYVPIGMCPAVTLYCLYPRSHVCHKDQPNIIGSAGRWGPLVRLVCTFNCSTSEIITVEFGSKTNLEIPELWHDRTLVILLRK